MIVFHSFSTSSIIFFLIFSCCIPVTRCCILSIISYIFLFLFVSHFFYSRTVYDALFFVHISLLQHFTTRQASQHLISNDSRHFHIILSYHHYHSGYGSDTSKNSRTRNNENTRGWNAGSGVRSGSGKYARSMYKDSGYSSAGSQVCTHVRSFFHKNFLVSYFARICFFLLVLLHTIQIMAATESDISMLCVQKCVSSTLLYFTSLHHISPASVCLISSYRFLFLFSVIC